MMAIVLSLVLLGADPSYADAYNASLKDHQLLIVLVSTEWCGPCRKIKQDPHILPALRKHDGHFAYLDADKEPDTAKSLAVTSVPQLIVYRYDRKLGWRVRRFLGYDDIKAFAIPQVVNVPAPTR